MTRAGLSSPRFDWEEFYLAVERERLVLRLTRRQVARSVNLSASTFTRLSQRRSLAVEGVVKLAKWAGLSLDDFVR